MTEPLQLESLLPHRAPMLLLDKATSVAVDRATAEVLIKPDSLFFVPGKGVPVWAGLEMMGQTAALIAGFQQQQGTLAPHTGFLLGSRFFKTRQPWLLPDTRYSVTCMQATVVGENLASFDCAILLHDNLEQAQNEPIATAALTVFRQPKINKTIMDTPS